MFGRSLEAFEDDPFFSGFSFPQFGSELMPFDSGRDGKIEKKRNKNAAKNADYGDPFRSMFQSMSTMMSNMHSQMRDVENNPDGHCFSSSTVMSYQNDGKSKPKFMQASTSTRKAPGQVCVTLNDAENQ